MDHIDIPKLTPVGPPPKETPEIRKCLDEMAGAIEQWLKNNPSKFAPFSLHVGSPDPDYIPPIRLTDYDSGEVIAIPPSIIRKVTQLQYSRDFGVELQDRSVINGPGVCVWIVRESAQTINGQIAFRKRGQEKATLIDTEICPPVELKADSNQPPRMTASMLLADEFGQGCTAAVAKSMEPFVGESDASYTHRVSFLQTLCEVAVSSPHPTESRWSTFTPEGDTVEYHHIAGEHCKVHIETRPQADTQGQYLAILIPNDENNTELGRLSWPRWYQDLSIAKCEVEAWLVSRAEFPPASSYVVAELPKPELPTYQCDYCPAKWWTAGQLEEHINKCHADRA